MEVRLPLTTYGTLTLATILGSISGSFLDTTALFQSLSAFMLSLFMIGVAKMGRKAAGTHKATKLFAWGVHIAIASGVAFVVLLCRSLPT